MKRSPLSATVTLVQLCISGFVCLPVILAASGCGSAPKPLIVAADQVTSLEPGVKYLLPANTKLEAMNKCVVSFPGADLFEPGDVIGEVVVIDDDALIYLAPHNEKISVDLQIGHSLSITKSRTITVDKSDAAPCRFEVTPPENR